MGDRKNSSYKIAYAQGQVIRNTHGGDLECRLGVGAQKLGGTLRKLKGEKDSVF